MNCLKIISAFGLCAISAVSNAAMVFTTSLDPAQEVATLVPVSSASGIGSLQLSGGPGTWSLAYDLTVDGLDWGNLFDGTPRTLDTDDDVSGFHIHNAARGANGSVVYGIFGPDHDNDNDVLLSLLGPTEARISGAWGPLDGASAGNLQGFVDDLINAPIGGDVPLYFNVHTPAYPAGEIRGQIVAAAPEPGAIALLTIGLAAFGAAGRRRASTPIAQET